MPQLWKVVSIMCFCFLFGRFFSQWRLFQSLLCFLSVTSLFSKKKSAVMEHWRHTHCSALSLRIIVKVLTLLLHTVFLSLTHIVFAIGCFEDDLRLQKKSNFYILHKICTHFSPQKVPFLTQYISLTHRI